jgi:hypothetical protein
VRVGILLKFGKYLYDRIISLEYGHDQEYTKTISCPGYNDKSKDQLRAHERLMRHPQDLLLQISLEKTREIPLSN